MCIPVYQNSSPRRILWLTHTPNSFYSSGYQDGYDHGRLHGLFEGREIGKEKAYEIWEEVGYYEGWAMSHLASGAGVKGKQARYAFSSS